MRGSFVYQRKREDDAWERVPIRPLSSLSAGEDVRLELHSEEVLTFFCELNSLYQMYRARGIPMGEGLFVRVDEAVARFLQLSERELRESLEVNQDGASKLLAAFIGWASLSPVGAAAVMRLASLAPEKLPSFAALTSIAAVKAGLARVRDNLGNSDEDYWQRTLEENSMLLHQAFAYPVVWIGSKAYVGGKRISNQGGGLVDFLSAVETTRAVGLIEIKTPVTRLLGPAYRDDVYPVSRELSGAIVQVLA